MFGYGERLSGSACQAVVPDVEQEAGLARGAVPDRAELGRHTGGGGVLRRDVADEAARAVRFQHPAAGGGGGLSGVAVPPAPPAQDVAQLRGWLTKGVVQARAPHEPFGVLDGEHAIAAQPPLAEGRSETLPDRFQGRRRSVRAAVLAEVAGHLGIERHSVQVRQVVGREGAQHEAGRSEGWDLNAGHRAYPAGQARGRQPATRRFPSRDRESDNPLLWKVRES